VNQEPSRLPRDQETRPVESVIYSADDSAKALRHNAARNRGIDAPEMRGSALEVSVQAHPDVDDRAGIC
jgi:hypothetical protein